MPKMPNKPKKYPKHISKISIKDLGVIKNEEI